MGPAIFSDSNLLAASLGATLIASLSGSFHCLMMCGGIASHFAPTRSTLFYYHTGRLLGYLGLGIVAGLIGETLLQASWLPGLQWISLALFSIGLMVSGVRVILGKEPLQWSSVALRRISKSGYGLAFRQTSIPFRSALMGLCSPFLPCGWLYTFVILALSSGSVLGGALILFAFWIGTLPVLLGGGFLVSILRLRGGWSKKAVAMLLIGVGLSSLVTRSKVFFVEKSPNSNLICH